MELERLFLGGMTLSSVTTEWRNDRAVGAQCVSKTLYEQWRIDADSARVGPAVPSPLQREIPGQLQCG